MPSEAPASALERSASLPRPASEAERWSRIVFLPIVLTVTGPLWLPAFSHSVWPLFIPQGVGYLALAAWLAVNDRRNERLFIVSSHLKKAWRWGAAVGLLTAAFNLWVIVDLTPRLGLSYDFLRDTPHARMPFFVMVPGGILLIAALVELNFRGFLLGRLLNLWGITGSGRAAAVLVSALVFSFDPYMVSVFRGYHWLALSDGLIWGLLLLRTRNLASTVTAHAVEVILVYAVLKTVFA